MDLIAEEYLTCMSKWIYVTKCKTGERIYHYTNVSALKGIVTQRSFWATKSDFLNDKYEFQYAFKVIKKICGKLIKNSDVHKAFIKALKNEVGDLTENINNQVMSGMYVLSFSKERDSLLLWTEFSQSLGYCMEFDYSQLEEGLQEPIALDGYVIYEKEKQIDCVVRTLKQIIGKLMKENPERMDLENFFEAGGTVSEESIIALAKEFALCCMVYSMFFKKECFAGEKEYRFVFLAIHQQTEQEKYKNIRAMEFREKDQVLIPYIEVAYEQGEGENPIKSIIVGPKNDSDLAVKGIKYFLGNERIHIPVYESRIPLRY